MEKFRQAKIRISATEREIINAIVKVKKTYPDLTTEEIGAAMLKLLSSMVNDEIKQYCK